MNDDVKVTLTVEMTPEEYLHIKNDATWQGKSVAEYMVWKALGHQRKGC